MFDRFTDQARRVVVHAQEEARMQGCVRVGSEHILLGLYLAGDSTATQGLESQGVSIEAVRTELPQDTTRAARPALGYLPYQVEAKKALDLSRREALQLGHHHIGAGHILLGLIRGGDSTAARLLVALGVELCLLRDETIELLGGDFVRSEESVAGQPDPGGHVDGEAERSLIPAILSLVESIDFRLSAVERRVGTGPDVGDLDLQITRARRSKETAVGAEDYETAAALRDSERQLLAEKASRQQDWATAQPDLPSMAEALRRLTDEVERLRGALPQHGIQPRGGAA
jgi:Clp amino terminal domain, pathogenicity island component/UvrB/uvrC motif